MAQIPLTEEAFENDPFSPLIEDPRGLPQPPASGPELKLLGQLQEKINHARQARKSREYGWEYNRLMLRGEQYVGQVAATGEVVRLVFEDGDTESLPSTDNLLLETARSAVGKYIRIIPSVVVLPRSEDRSDMRAAEVIDSFAEFQWDNLQMKLLYKRGHEYMMWAGTAPYEVCWDREAGRRLAYCPQCHFASDIEQPGQPCPVCLVSYADPVALSQNGGQLDPSAAPKLTPIKEGDCALTLHDPRAFFPQPGVPEICDMQYVFTETPVPINVLRRRYPDKAGLIRAQDGIYTESNAVYALGTASARYDTQPLRGHAYEVRMHLAPSGKQKKGTLVTLVNDRIMRVEESPYYEMFEQHPFEALRSDREARVFWGIPPMDNATGLQKEYNTLSTQTREHREMTANPKLMVGTNSGIDVDRMSTVPGEVLKVKPTPFGRPAYLIPPPLAQYVYTEFERISRAIRGKFAVTDNEAGIAPADQSGRLGAILEAQGNEAISPIVLENLQAWIKLNYFTILIGLKYYPRDRLWAVRGQDMPRSYTWGHAGDIRVGWNLILADEDALSKNPALRLQQAVLLWDKGVYNNEATGLPDKKKFMRHANLRMPGMVPDAEGAHRAYAAMIPERVMRGEPFQPKPWDDALICAQEICDWLRVEGDKQPGPVVMEVFRLWTIYVQAALAQGADPRTLTQPNPALAGPPQQGAGGGAPGAPGALPAGPGTGAPPAPTVSGEAGQLIQQADASAEGSARASRKEGSTL